MNSAGRFLTTHIGSLPRPDALMQLMFAREEPHAILFEAANPRHAHEWALLESAKLPEGKVLVPGVIECQSTYIEHPQLVAQRIGRYAHLLGRESVMAAVDCGFSIDVGSSGVDPEVMWGKLEALAPGAAIASKRLWR